jgi:hypothetical protein
MMSFTKCLEEIEVGPLDEAISKLEPDQLAEYEEVIELWITYGGD